MSRDREVILRTEKLCKSFASEGLQNHVLDDIDMEIYRGEFAVVMGSSGSGKSTLLHSLSGMDRPTSGKVFYGDTEITALPEKKLTALRAFEFGFVFQQVQLVSNLTLLENVLVTGYLDRKKTKAEVNERANELLDLMDVGGARDRLPSMASGGEAQRAAIARALINSPGIVFADEPTGALNRRNTEAVLDIMTRLHENGQTILMVTHDVRAAMRAERIIYLEDGKASGELSLPLYSADESEVKNREIQVNAWLQAMHW